MDSGVPEAEALNGEEEIEWPVRFHLSKPFTYKTTGGTKTLEVLEIREPEFGYFAEFPTDPSKWGFGQWALLLARCTSLPLGIVQRLPWNVALEAMGVLGKAMGGGTPTPGAPDSEPSPSSSPGVVVISKD